MTDPSAILIEIEIKPPDHKGGVIKSSVCPLPIKKTYHCLLLQLTDLKCVMVEEVAQTNPLTRVTH